MTLGGSIKDVWAGLAIFCQGAQRKAFLQRLRDGQSVRAKRLGDVFSDEEIRKIKYFLRPQKHECYKNAHNLCALFPKRVKYVEGELSVCGFGVAHAWNIVDDCVYIDVTAEMVLGDDPTSNEYVALGVYDLKTINAVAHERRVYGEIYNYFLTKKLKSNGSYS